MRHKMPDVVRIYKQSMDLGAPKCCHTCDFYQKDGVCEKHDAIPPEDFAAKLNACPDFWAEIPF
jgi:hypothetical protein